MLVAMLAACTSENLEVPASEPEQTSLAFDLNALSYEDVMTRLSETNTLKDVTFTDGDVVKTIAELKASDNLDPDQAEALVFTSGNPADSLDMTVTPEYVTVRSTVNGELLAYVAYADGRYQAKLADFYAQLAPATRSGEGMVTRSTDGGSMKMNLTGLREQMKAQYERTGSYVLEAEAPAISDNVATRGWFSNLFKKVAAVFKPAPAPVVKTPTVDIYLMRERGSNPVAHEMNWQVNDAIFSLKDVESNVKFNVHIADCDFRGSKNPDNDLGNFRAWVRQSSYRTTNGIFILCRWGGWDKVLGEAYVNDYNVNNDRTAYGISCTNAWNKFTMAHEVGHIFGAGHVATKWWQVLWSSDLMSANSYDWLGSGKHKDGTNRGRIKANLTLN